MADRGERENRWFSPLLTQLKECVAALRFLSTLPAPGSSSLFSKDTSDPRVILGSAYFPLIGAILALLLSLLSWLVGAYVPPLVLSALSVVALICLTGGLHLDGLMDSCDGLFGGRTRERKLEIMRDSRVGSFGVLGAVSLLLLEFAALASLNRGLLPVAFWCSLPISRWSMVLAVRLFPAARAEGLGAVFQSTVTLPRCLFAGLTAMAFAVASAHLFGLVLWGIGSLLAVGTGWWIIRLVGGLTGDSYGAIAELSEVAVLLIFVVGAGRGWL
jgi:adenosylcobinamide-GDP ribazoletransferase